jgi:hypothetical protein
MHALYQRWNICWQSTWKGLIIRQNCKLKNCSGEHCFQTWSSHLRILDSHSRSRMPQRWPSGLTCQRYWVRMSVGARTVLTEVLCSYHQQMQATAAVLPRITQNGFLPHSFTFIVHKGRAVAQTVSCRIPSTVARVRAQVRTYGICGGRSGTGAAFSLSISVSPANHSTDCSSPSIYRGWYNAPNGGRCTKWTRSLHSPVILSSDVV